MLFESPRYKNPAAHSTQDSLPLYTLNQKIRPFGSSNVNFEPDNSEEVFSGQAEFGLRIDPSLQSLPLIASIGFLPYTSEIVTDNAPVLQLQCLPQALLARGIIQARTSNRLFQQGKMKYSFEEEYLKQLLKLGTRVTMEEYELIGQPRISLLRQGKFLVNHFKPLNFKYGPVAPRKYLPVDSYKLARVLELEFFVEAEI